MYKSITAFLLFLLFSASLFAQSLNIDYNDYNKIDPRMHFVIEEFLDHKAKESKNYLTAQKIDELFSLNEQGQKVFGLVIRSNQPSQLKRNGIPVNSVYENFVTARLTAAQIISAVKMDEVEYITLGEIYYPTNDVATGLIGADLVHDGYINSTSYEGDGVIVCIIDTGIDWEHLDFRDAVDDTKSRILYIWDQTLSKTGAEGTPEDRDATDFSGLDYGVEYTKTHIQDEIDGSPAGFVREEDTNGHGTHVAGTAAGNGAALTSNKYAGIAPNADLLIIKAGNGSFPTSNTVDALTYAREVAEDEGKPVVVNMSLGGHSAPHDGTSTLAQAVDAFIGLSGRVVVISAGNEGGDNIHISGTLPSSGSSTIEFTIPSYTPNSGTDNDYFGFDLWLDDDTDADATVTSPNGVTYTRSDSQSGKESDASDGTIYLFNDVNATNSDREIYMYIDDDDATKTPAVGTWELVISNNTASSVTYHGWLFGSALGSKEATLVGGDSLRTVGSPGTSAEAITVGAYASRWRWLSTNGSGYLVSSSYDQSDDIAKFSSIGPTRTGSQKPDLAAPGQRIASSLSADDSSPSTTSTLPGDKHILSQGTSMSCPVVTGAVALLLEHDGTLTGSAIKTLLTDNTDSDSYTGGSLPDFFWGAGKLNIFKALAESINSSWTPNQEILVYDEFASDASTGIGATVMIAVKITPTIAGSLTGLFFHPSTTIDITSDLSLEIWSDNGSGLPDSKLGSTVTFDKDNILNFSWNYADMQSSGVTSLSVGTDYHLVLYFATGTSFFIRVDDGNVDNRSSINTGAGWSAVGSGDYRIRGVVSTESSVLPVELVSFSGELIDGDVLLEWETAIEINNFGFDVERRVLTDESKWEKIGFVDGHGTTASPKYYEYLDVSPPAEELEYRLKQIDNDGTFEYFRETAKVNASVTSVEDQIPTQFSLHQNYPNPFNPTTTIKFDLPEKSDISISLFNILGQKVKTITRGIYDAGYHEVNLNVVDLASNIYIYRLESKIYNATKKMILLK
ncbi:MAG: S8 family peptidase [Melioribacteraceae bacterium]|nr:S8 family peptidase [Melioribacteraceae bacterium]